MASVSLDVTGPKKGQDVEIKEVSIFRSEM